MEASKSLLAFIFLMCFISTSSAYIFTVGGPIGWAENPPVPYNNWSGGLRFSVNDTLVFNYKQGDSVLVVKKESYDSCNVTNPLQKLDNGVYKLGRSGPHYFISGAVGHCSNGEKMIVVVLAIRNPPRPPGLAPPAPAPVPVVSPAPSSLSPSPSPVVSPAPSSLSPSPSPASVTAPAPAPAPSSLSPSPSPASVTAPAPAPSSLSPSPSPTSVPGLAPSSVSPAPSTLSPPPSPSPSSVPFPSPSQPGSAPSETPSGSVPPPPSTPPNSSPVLRMSFGLFALMIGSALMI